MRLFRFIIGIILIPVAIILTIGFIKSFAFLQEVKHSEVVFLSGFLSYLILHFLFYKPIFMHVMAHEFTHAIWAIIFGGKVKSLNISEDGGNITVDKTNFLIILAPYFFPFYTVLVILLYFIVDKRFIDFVIFFIGFTLSFHLALTLFSMKERQKDLKEVGVFFSLSFIYCVNLLIMAIIFSVISPQFYILNFFNEIWKILLGIGDLICPSCQT
ncbi:MAG: M50 family metallopeptidase [Candidatus Firestonebacteria bacterium]